MATENELDELRARIGRLNGGELMRLFELALGDSRRKRDEVRAELLAADQAFLAHENQRRGLAGAAPLPETKREAG